MCWYYLFKKIQKSPFKGTPLCRFDTLGERWCDKSWSICEINPRCNWGVRAGDVTKQEAIKSAQTKLSLAFCVFTSALCETVLVLFGVVCQYSLLVMASKQQQAFKMCVHPCPRYLTIHTFFVLPVWERSMHAQACSRALAVSTAMCFPCDLDLAWRSFARAPGLRIPQGSGPAVDEAQRRLQSWGSQRDLSAEAEMSTALSLPSPDRFSDSPQGWEARAVVSSAPIEPQTLRLSDSEELDVVSANTRDTEDSPPQSRAHEELVEVVTRAVERLSIDWPAEREDVRSKGKLDECFLPSHAQLQVRGLPFFLRMGTREARSTAASEV